ncbi:VCBS domain-containing protein, partial [Vibrio sp. 10N.286.49.B3]|uniref:VCBS domain-containing protein n=1 Tax=Vibrio sp. 10N.286.49.B3 TaxID=1880855 RepID=UPI001F535504
SGQLTITDADGVQQEVFVSSSVVPAADALGTLTLTEDGAWTYNVDNADVQYLDEGETKDEVFTITSQDGTAHTITVTITGVNDAAIISGDAVGEVVEDESTPTLTDNGQLTITDADGVLQEVFDPTSVVPAADVLGTLTLT